MLLALKNIIRNYIQINKFFSKMYTMFQYACWQIETDQEEKCGIT